jgi:hypothetical protein
MPQLPPIAIAVQGGEAMLVLETFEEDGRMICGVFQLEGRLQLPPKAWLRTIRNEMAKIERIAAAAGCAELRLRGRDWIRIFPNYEPWPGFPNGLRKRL